MEIWKDIKGYEGIYQVSNLGRVKSLHIKRSGWELLPRDTTLGKIISYRANPPHYYYQVTLFKNGERKAKRVSRLVAEAFIPNPLNLPQVNHKDMNKKNDCVDNLEWCTNKQNMEHARKLRQR
jgi:hypothetical protein